MDSVLLICCVLIQENVRITPIAFTYPGAGFPAIVDRHLNCLVVAV